MNDETDYLAADWEAPAGIVAGTTLRGGGVSRGPFRSLNLAAHVGDDPQAVSANRRRFHARIGLAEPACWLEQVHGTTVAVDAVPGSVPRADAAVATGRNHICAVLTADCLPVLFTTSGGGAVGAAHAGWRGLMAGVLEATVAAFACAPGELLAWLGPAISTSAFEVGDEVRQAFVDRDAAAAGHFSANDRGRWQADLYGLARQRLERAGVKRVTGGEYCTVNEPERWFSYRRNGRCGRMASFICRIE